MIRLDDQERLQILRGLLFLRLALLAPFFAVVLYTSLCKPGVGAGLNVLLLIMAGAPTLFYFLRRDLMAHGIAPGVLVLFDFVLASLLSLLTRQNQGLPIFFPLYFSVVALQASCWWGWPGSLISAAAGAAFLSWLYLDTPALQPNQGLGLVTLVMAWPIVLGFFTQWALQQWRERRRLTNWLSHQSEWVRQVQDRLNCWHETCLALQRETSAQSLLQRALYESMRSTGSTLGLIAVRDLHTGLLRAEHWEGFALPGPNVTTLQRAARLPALRGNGVIEVQHTLEAALRAAVSSDDKGAADLGRIVIAREGDLPYQETEQQWLQIIASYTAALLENRFLRGQLGRMQEEADSVAVAGWTLASLPDPAAAIEMACRSVLKTLNLQEIVIFLYGKEEEQGCRVIVYPLQGPVRTAVISLQGRGLRLLRRFLDSGTSLIINRRAEYPQIFDLMAWDKEVQALACFPLSVLEHRWGALCLLSRTTDAFPSQTQQTLAIFSGEISMALENFYLRHNVARAQV